MKYHTICRSDFRETASANFFEDFLYALGIPEEQWEDIDSVELKIHSFETDAH